MYWWNNYKLVGLHENIIIYSFSFQCTWWGDKFFKISCLMLSTCCGSLTLPSPYRKNSNSLIKDVFSTNTQSARGSDHNSTLLQHKDFSEKTQLSSHKTNSIHLKVSYFLFFRQKSASLIHNFNHISSYPK